MGIEGETGWHCFIEGESLRKEELVFLDEERWR